ncbi:MAG TPA: S41 family peptidase [Candidatus Angelobacter sp.]|nr:S41 family peptidase [Candidatus Angelobacter sp.]
MLRKLLNHALAVAALTGALLAQSGPTNLDFEAGELGGVPQGWKATSPSGGTNPGYTARLTSENARQGKYCAELASDGQGSAFGNLMQSFDATAYRGKRVRFRAAVRAQGQAQLWVRVDRKGGEMGFFDNMGDRPIREQEWKYYEITGDVEPDAELINFGVILVGSGKLWIDDASFQALGDTPRLPPEPARPLTARGLQNEVAFARLYGLVRYFHPSDQAARVDWNTFVVRGVREVEAAKDDAALAKTLMTLFAPVAPTLRVLPAGEEYFLPAELQPEKNSGLKVIYWRHHGVGMNGPKHTYHSEREQESIAKADGKSIPSPGSPWEADLGGVKAWAPMALFVDAQGTVPHVAGDAETKKDDTPLLSGDDRAVRLADVAIAWNIFEHFYPYFDVARTDWSAALPRYLQAAASDKDAIAFKDTLSRLVAELHDGHAGVYKGRFTASLPLAWDWVEGRLVITAAGTADGQLARGDSVSKINGRPVAELLAAKEELTSGATPQWVRWSALQQLALGEKEQTAKLTVESFSHPGEVREVSLKYQSLDDPVQEARPAKIAELEKGIFYIDIGRITDADFDAALPQLEKARGIVFDFRGYPRQLGPAFLTHLSDHAMTSAQWHIPVVLWPDRRGMTFERGGEWDLTPAQPLLQAKKAFVTDGRAISYAESCMGIVEAYKLGAIVGGPTAGTNGNVNPFTLPGGYQVAWTGMKVLKHDGSRHHGVGIIPTIPVTRTRAAIAAGHDEFLDRAIAAVKE